MILLEQKFSKLNTGMPRSYGQHRNGQLRGTAVLKVGRLGADAYFKNDFINSKNQTPCSSG